MALPSDQHALDAYRYAMQHHPDLMGDKSFLDQITGAVRRKPVLTVSDLVRLGQAGVKVDLSDLKHEVVSDPTPETAAIHSRNQLVDMIYERMRMSQRAKHSANGYDSFDGAMTMAPEMWATPYKDKVYVFVATGNQAPMIIEDEQIMFPSDALLAKLALLRDSEKMNGVPHTTDIPSVSPSSGVASAGRAVGQSPIHAAPYRHNGGKLIP